MPSKDFDTNLFLRFFFSVIFLFSSCFLLMLYIDKVLALFLVFMLRFVVLPRNIRLSFTGLHFAPLQARVLFRGFSLQTENMSLRIVDGYFTFAFWGFWFRHPRWARLREYMVSDALIGTRCRVRHNLHYVKGSIVAVDAENKKVSVQLDERNTDGSTLGDDEDVTGEEDGGVAEPLPGVSGSASGNPRHNPALGESFSMKSANSQNVCRDDTIDSTLLGPRQTRRKEFGFSSGIGSLVEQEIRNEAHMHAEGLGDEVVKTVDVNDVHIRSRAGLLQLHLNGVRLCLYNATGKYLDLAKAAAAGEHLFETRTREDSKASTERSADAEQAGNLRPAVARKEQCRPRNWLSGLLQAIGKYVLSSKEAELGTQIRDEAQESSQLRAARKLQEQNILTPSFAQKFFNFIGCVEMEICAAQLDIGSVASSHPYFLHFTFQQGEGRVFLTKDSCPALDLYRTVLELTLREVDIRMAKMDSKLSKTQVMRNATLLERARLMVSGVAVPYDHMPFETTASSELIDNYGIFMDRKDKGSVHLVFYKDAPNVYAGEAVRRGALPTTGVEVLIDAPVVRYGPWLEYCRTELWQYFLPPNYLPLQELQFEMGKPRPNAGFELLIMFLRPTTIEIPFKRPSIVPSPPFGIHDSKRKGMIVATIGEGAQYIQPAFFLLPKEEKQIFQGLFIAKNVTVRANCVLERETVLCSADSLQFFLDREDDRLWNGRKLWNILAKLCGAELYWYMVYIDYFLDLLNDWQFSACMYHDAPLTTEMYNTVNRVVWDCVPNVKRFEVFLESLATVYLNVNTRNVVYTEDPNDFAHNAMAVVTMQSGCFSVVLPNDQYQLSFENEVARPMEASAREMKAYLRLPVSHPLYSQVSSEIPWAYAESFRMQGLFTMLVPNQSIPLPRNNLDTATGRTRYHNFFNLDLELVNLCGTIMGTHIKALLNCFQNTFLDNTFTIQPDELFWLLAKLQSHAATGKNKRKEFKEFLQWNQPAGNDVEVSVTVRLVDVSATATTSLTPGAPQVNLSTGLFTFTYVGQASVSDMGVSLTPLTVRFPERRGNFSKNAKSNIVVGAITVGITNHFGRMPLKPKVHSAREIHVGGLSWEVGAEQLVMLVEVARTVAQHLEIEDSMMEAAVAEALATAELSAEKVIRCSSLRNITGSLEMGMRRRHAGQSSVPYNCRSAAMEEEGVMSVGSLFGDRSGDYEGKHGDEHGSDAVEMREWRSAQRTGRLSSSHSISAFTADGDIGAHDQGDAGGAVVVAVGGQAHDEPIASPTASAMRGECAGTATAPGDLYMSEGDYILPALHSYESEGRPFSSGRHGRRLKRRRRFFNGLSRFPSSGSDDDCEGAHRRPFVPQVAYDVAVKFAKFMEECNKAEDNSRDYGLFFLLVDVGTVTGVVRIGEDGYASVELPLGVRVAHSTVNDGNSNKRMSIAIKDVGVQLLLSRTSEVAKTYLPSLQADNSSGMYIEVLSLRTSVCMRQYVAYPLDGSLESHRRRQQQFVEENDFEHLISFPFNKTSTQCPETPARTSGPELTAMASESSNGGKEPHLTSRRHSSVIPVAEAGTPPCLSLQNTTGPPSTTNGFYSPMQEASLAVPPPPADGDWTPSMVPLTLSRGDDGDATSASLLRRASTNSADDVSPPSSPNSQSTMVHTHLGGEAYDPSRLQSTFPSLSATFPTSDKDNQMRNRFATCMSVSSSIFSSGKSSPDVDLFFDTSSADSFFQQCTMKGSFPVNGELLKDCAEKCAAHWNSCSEGSMGIGNSTGGLERPGNKNCRSRGKWEACTSPNGGGLASSPAASLLPMTAPHVFYRTFDKAERNDQGTCALDYWPQQRRSSNHKVRDRTGFHARLPVVGFYLNTNCESHAPPFFFYSKRQMLQREEDLFAWARCAADNRERSKNNSTSRHLHIAFLDPVTLLVTPEAAVLTSAATRLALRVYHSLHGRCTHMPRDMSTSENPVNASNRAALPLRLRLRIKKSKARTQQQHWLWENNIVSVSVPTAEVKLLTRLPVPVENLPSESSVTDGVYTSTIVVRNLRVLVAHNRPPAGEDIEVKATQQISASVRVDTIAVIAQIESEPMQREGNLTVKVPDIWYNADKATMAVIFLTQVSGKLKRDQWRGADGGASNITVAEVAAYVTRDFADYVHGLMCLVEDVTADVRRRMKVRERFFSAASLWASDLNADLFSMPRAGYAPAAPNTSGVLGYSAGPTLFETPQTRKGRVVQGKGFVRHVVVTLIDTVRVGQHIVVNDAKVNRLEIHRPFCTFVVVTPHLQRDRHMHIQGIGEVDEVSARVFPSLLHILHPRVRRRNRGIVNTTADLPKFINSRTPSCQLDALITDDRSATIHSSGHIAPAEPESRPLAFIYDGTFTVHQLDLRVQQSGTNYVQLVGKDMTGCAESRAEGVASRECVQAEALTESISPTLKERLRYKANKARERAKRSRYPAPPETTEQLQLRSTASFFAQEMQVHYVADCLTEPISQKSEISPQDPADSQSMKTSKVFTAAVTDVALVAQFSQQVNLKGEQVNLHMMVRSTVFQSLYCVRAADTLHPQVQALISSWRQALRAASRSVRPRSAVDRRGSAIIFSKGSVGSQAAERGPAKPQQSRAVTFHVQATSITGFVGVAQGIVQKFLLPEISCFTKTSSNGRADLKLHLHPFTITSHNTPLENYSVVLPHVYILYAHDTIKMLCNVTVGTVAITITPLFINHSLLTYEKLVHDMAAVIASPNVHVDDKEQPATEVSSLADAADAAVRRRTSSATSSPPSTVQAPVGGRSGCNRLGAGFGYVPVTDGSPTLEGTTTEKDGCRDWQKRNTQSTCIADGDSCAAAASAAPLPMCNRRRSFLFLLQGARLSYLTSMTTLRLTVRNLNVTADTTEGSMQHVLDWVVNVTDTQAALVDRDDHDQMVAAHNSLSQRSSVESHEMHGSRAANVSSRTYGSGRAANEANTMKTAYPLGGFLWGSIALSFTLSSGKVDDNRARSALQDITSLGSYSEELQKALLDSLTTSTSKWELAVFEPLVMVRFGLDSLIKQCVRETEEDIRAMKNATYEADLSAGTRLREHKRFQRLQAEKKRIDRFIKRAEKERHWKLRTMTERVVHDVTHRCSMLPTDVSENDTLLDFFRTRRSHKVVVSVSNFMVVLPFGDAAYRSVLEELPGVFACDKTGRHIHTAACLNRHRFIPSFALKMKMSDVSFICNLEVTKQIVPVRAANEHPCAPHNPTLAHDGTTDQDYTTSLLFHGRLLALNSHLYFSDGSPLNKSYRLRDLLRNAPILGGQDVLTSYAAQEHGRSLNNISVVSIEAPLCVAKKDNTLHISVVVDVSEPKASMSSRILSIVHALSQEQTALPLQVNVRARRSGRSPSPRHRSRNTRRTTNSFTRAISSDYPAGSRGAEAAAAQPQPKEPLSLHLDVTARMEEGELAVFCYSNPEKGYAQNSAPAARAAGGGGARAFSSPSSMLSAPPVTRRCVSFETPSSQSSRMRVAQDARAGANTSTKGANVNRSKQKPPQSESGDGTDFYSDKQFLIMSVPLPGITLRALVRRGGRETSENVDVVRVEVRAGTIELSPSITALAQEVEMCARIDEQNHVARSQRITAFVQSMEAEVTQLRAPLHCPLVEVLLPMPRAYTSVLSRARLDNVASLRRTGPPLITHSSSTGETNLDRAVVAVGHKPVSIISVYVSIVNLRLIFNSEPVASTHFRLYLDQGGTLNFVLKYREQPDRGEHFVNVFPDRSLVVAMRRLRAECQTKLEVKSLEVTLPEAELAISRRSGHIGIVNSVSVHLPFNTECNEPNLTGRIQHMSQLFLVTRLWSITASETLKTARRLFQQRGIASAASKEADRTNSAPLMGNATPAFQKKPKTAKDCRTLAYVGLSRAVCFFDLGAGSTQSLTIGSANVVAEYARRANGCTVSRLLGRISNTSIRSEGVLSGGVVISDVMAKAFLIQNSDDTEGFVRSPEQRTFRATILMEEVHVNFKERQLKDVFECKVGSFHCNSMDGIGEEDYTTTDMNIMLERGTLGVTPSTVPAFLSFVRNISAVVAEQRCIAKIRMSEVTPPFLTFQSVAGGSSSPVISLQKPMPTSREHSTASGSIFGSEASVATQRARVLIPFMGNALLRVPCGQLCIRLEKTTVLLGAIASGEAAVGCVVLSFPKARLSFAECPCDDYTAVKKVLVMESHNVEVYRPGVPRIVVMGFQGVNYFEFYTRQMLGSAEVGFALTLQQTHPWTGNPRFLDFEEMMNLLKSFTDKKNAAVFQHFGQVDAATLSSYTSSQTPRHESGSGPAAAAAGAGTNLSRDASLMAVASASTIRPTTTAASRDTRTLKALRSSTFSPQLRFGGDVSVNTEVILNWLGVTEKMLPHAVHTALCDKLEKLLYSLSNLASERVTHREEDKRAAAEPSSSCGSAL